MLADHCYFFETRNDYRYYFFTINDRGSTNKEKRKMNIENDHIKKMIITNRNELLFEIR